MCCSLSQWRRSYILMYTHFYATMRAVSGGTEPDSPLAMQVQTMQWPVFCALQNRTAQLSRHKEEGTGEGAREEAGMDSSGRKIRRKRRKERSGDAVAWPVGDGDAAIGATVARRVTATQKQSIEVERDFLTDLSLSFSLLLSYSLTLHY